MTENSRIWHRFFNTIMWVSCLLSAVFVYAEQKPTSIKIAVSDNVVPYQFLDDNNQPAGYVIDFWRLWQTKTGINVEFVPTNWAETITNLQSGNVDLHGAIAVNEERARHFDFSGHVYSATFSIYVHRDLIGLSSLDDVTPYLVGTLKNSAYEPILLSENPALEFKYYDTRQQFLSGIANGDVKTFVNFDFFAFRYKGFDALNQLYPAYKRVNVGAIEAAYAVQKGNDSLLRIVDAGLAQITNQERAALERKWFGVSNNNASLLLSLSTGNEPYMSVGPNGEAIGLFVDLWKKWAEKTQTEVEFMPNSMDLSLEALQQGKTQIHIAYPESNLVNTGLPRAKHLYSVYSNLFITGEYDERQGMSQLKGSKIGLFTTAPYKNEFVEKYPDIEVVWYENLDAMLNAAVNLEIKGFVAANQMSIVRLIQNNVNNLFQIVDEVNYESKIYSIINEDNRALIKKINDGFSLISQKELSEIENRWIKEDSAKYFVHGRHKFQLTDKEKDWIALVPEVSVGVVRDWRPYEFQTESGDVAGINVDVFNIAKELTGQTFNFVVFPTWEELMKSFKAGELDMVANISATEDRMTFSDFTSSFWHTPWSITTDKSVPNVDSILGFFGKRLAIIEEYQMIQDIHEQYPEVIIQVVESYDEAVSLLKDGVIDGILDNMVVSAQFIQDNELYQFKIHVIEDLPYDTSHMGIRKGLPLQADIMEKVVLSISDKDRQNILNKWFKVDVVAGVSSEKYWRNITMSVVIAAIIIALILIWNRRLKSEISLRIEAESKLKHMASHDLLTGLPNRGLLIDRISQAIASHNRNDKEMAVMFLDLDGFKQVNDSFGHEVGDELLVQVAQRLTSNVRKSDTVARFGGDEFVLLVTSLNSFEESAKVAEKILVDFSEPFKLSSATVSVGTSIGIACYPKDDSDGHQLIKWADDAMYEVKSMGKNSYHFYSRNS